MVSISRIFLYLKLENLTSLPYVVNDTAELDVMFDFVAMFAEPGSFGQSRSRTLLILKFKL